MISSNHGNLHLVRSCPAGCIDFPVDFDYTIAISREAEPLLHSRLSSLTPHFNSQKIRHCNVSALNIEILQQIHIGFPFSNHPTPYLYVLTKIIARRNTSGSRRELSRPTHLLQRFPLAWLCISLAPSSTSSISLHQNTHPPQHTSATNPRSCHTHPSHS